MPTTRRSMTSGVAAPLESLSDNVGAATTTKKATAPAPAATPGKQVKQLKAELEQKDAENKALLDNIASLTSALNGLNLVKDKVKDAEQQVDGGDADGKKKKKKDDGAPVPAKTAYKYFCELNANHPQYKKDGVDMRQVWKECDADTRAKYVAMAAADKARYQQELTAHEEEKAALEMYHQQKKQDVAMELFEAHMDALAAVEKAEAAADKKGKKKAKAAKKDPEAPKRAMSSYMHFAVEQRESVAKGNPTASMTEIAKILGEMWNRLEKGKSGKDGTKKYDDLAAADKARYEGEKAEYDAQLARRKVQADQDKADRLQHEKEEAMKLLKSKQAAAAANAAAIGTVETGAMDDVSAVTDSSKKNGGKAAKKKKDPNAPKKASTAYLFFCNEKRGDIKSKMPENTTNAELLTEVGRQWKDLSDKKKAKYVKMADKDKERYAKEMEKYNGGNNGGAGN